MDGGRRRLVGKKKKQFCQLSSELYDVGNLDPLALSCSTFSYIFLTYAITKKYSSEKYFWP